MSSVPKKADKLNLSLTQPMKVRNVKYCQVSNIRRTKPQHLKDSRTVLRLSLLNPLKPDVEVENEDVVGAAPTGDAPTTSEWSTILLPTKVRLILEVLR